MSLRATHAATCVQQVQCRLLTDDGWQRDAERETVMDTEQGEVGCESRLWCRDPEVGSHGQAKTAADGCALNGRHNWYRLLKQPDRHVVEVRAAGNADSALRAEVCSGAEDSARAAQHYGAAAVARGELVAGIGDLSD